MQRKIIFPEGRQAIYERNGYSAAIQSGDLLFVSGQVGVLADGTVVDDPERQCRQAFDNLVAVLDAAGCGLGDIVDMTTFHVDLPAHMAALVKVKTEVFPAPPFPNWTAVGVAALADPRMIVEVKVIARVPSA